MSQGVFLVKADDKKPAKVISISKTGNCSLDLNSSIFDIKKLRFSNLNKMIQKLTKITRNEVVQDDLSGNYYKYLSPFIDISECIINLLRSSSISLEIEKFSTCSLGAWVDSEIETYFQISLDSSNINKVSRLLSNLHLAGIRKYFGSIALFLIYFENSFFVVLKEIEKKEQKFELNRFPNITARGTCLQVKVFHEDESQYGFKTLSICSTNNQLSNVLKGEKAFKQTHLQDFLVESVRIDEGSLVSSANESFKGGYTQTYLITRVGVMQYSSDDLRRALFRFGNWCYEGDILIEDKLSLHNVPLILRQFQKQQGKLRFTYETSKVPLSHPFQVSLSSLTLVCALVKEYILKSSHLLEKLEKIQIKRNLNPWIDAESGKQYFELQVSMQFLEEHFRNMDFLATKIYYHEVVFIVLKLPQIDSFFITINEARGDQPLLDLSFPDVSSRNRGYLLYSFDHPDFNKLMIWECETSVWQTSNRMVLQQQKENEDISSAKLQKQETGSTESEEENPVKRLKRKATKKKSIEKPVFESKTESHIEKEEKVNSSSFSKKPPTKTRDLKVKAPHHIKSIGKNLRQQSLSKLPNIDDAPWDEFGRPKALFKEEKDIC